MTTLATAIDLVVNRLGKSTSQLINVHNGALNSTQTNITLTYDMAGSGVGSIIEINTEQMYVVAQSSLTRTVIRGWNGTPAASHSSGAVIRVNPRFTKHAILGSFADELNSWPVELGPWDTVEVVVPAFEWIVELAPTRSGAAIQRLLDANIQPDTTSSFRQRSRIDVRMVRDADADEYTSGYAIQMPHRFDKTRTVQVDMITNFDLTAVNAGTTTVDLLTTTGVRSSLLDVLYYGVMWREMSSMEVGRTDPSANAPLDAAEVPPTHLMQAGAALKQIRDTRMSEERTRMHDTWPLLMTTAGS